MLIESIFRKWRTVWISWEWCGSSPFILRVIDAFCKVVLTFESVDEILKCNHSNESYFPMVLFIMLYKVVLTLEFVVEFLWCDHTNETFLAVLLRGIICVSWFHKMKFWNFGEFWLLQLLGVKWLTMHMSSILHYSGDLCIYEGDSEGQVLQCRLIAGCTCLSF